MENNKMDRKEKIQIAFLIIMLFAVSGLFFCGIKIVKYHEMLINPLGYSLDHFNISSCTCYNSEGYFEVKSISNTCSGPQKPGYEFNEDCGSVPTGEGPGIGINKQNWIIPKT
jgi:hypothetical protein